MKPFHVRSASVGVVGVTTDSHVSAAHDFGRVRFHPSVQSSVWRASAAWRRRRKSGGRRVELIVTSVLAGSDHGLVGVRKRVIDGFARHRVRSVDVASRPLQPRNPLAETADET